MARIRSIKPDFFTSETVAALSLSARLTFIGLWTYVDDNGVGQYNEMLINAAIWPLEEDSLETLARTREDLASLSRIRLVTLYRDSRKRYLFVNSWDEHQKVDHPRKPRYPRPGDEGCEPLLEPVPACENDDLREEFANDSRTPREDLAPEQGAGSREQGTKPGRQAGRVPVPGSDDDPDFTAFWDAYPRKVAKGAARTAWKSAMKKTDPKTVIIAAERYRDDRTRPTDITKTAHASTWLNAERWLDQTEATQRSPHQTPFWEN